MLYVHNIRLTIKKALTGIAGIYTCASNVEWTATNVFVTMLLAKGAFGYCSLEIWNATHINTHKLCLTTLAVGPLIRAAVDTICVTTLIRLTVLTITPKLGLALNCCQKRYPYHCPCPSRATLKSGLPPTPIRTKYA